ncbi:MAG: PadR family transcriptional regulator [Rhodothermaceae bacterium]
MKWLTKSEEMLLLAIWRLKENSYGVTIRKQLMEVTGENMTYGTLYSSLDQLYRKGYVKKRDGDPSPERGGRRKIFYSLTEKGLDALQKTKELNLLLWDGIDNLELKTAK